MAPLVDAVAAQQRQWAEIARHSDAFREALRRASEVSRAVSAVQPQLDQIAETIRLMQAQPSLRMGFSTPMLDQATGVLEQIRNAPPEAPTDIEVAVEVPDAAVQEAVEAIEPAGPARDAVRS
jgi:ABC-type transporter Mla subunit MlaD